MVFSVLAGIDRGDIRLDPFPHIVKENCLPSAYYRALSDAYPSDDLVVELDRRNREVLQNQRNDIGALKAFEHAFRLPAIWLEFISFHTSAAFYAQIVSLLAPEIRAAYPRLEQRMGRRLEDCRSGVRFVPQLDTGEISLDCQIGINTPVVQEGSVRGVHTDSVEELVAGLLYFRREEDDAPGGDLTLHRWREGRDRLFTDKLAAPEDVEQVSTVPYRPNTLVMFINSDHSLHGVSPRGVTPHSRRLVNLVVETYRSVPEGLFSHRQKATRDDDAPSGHAA